MAEAVKIYVASDLRMGKAELALQESIDRNTSGPVEVTMMRAEPASSHNEGSEFRIASSYSPEVWDIGREPNLPYNKGNGWATDFTMFRWAIPELCAFEGYAIYQDVDMIDVGDLRDLLDLGKESPSPILQSGSRSCVMVIDCAAIGRLMWWPSIEEMRRGGGDMYQIRGRLMREGRVDTSLSGVWNHLDKYQAGRTQICHYTQMRTQPWKPWPEHFDYPQHPNQAAVDLFWEYYALAEPNK